MGDLPADIWDIIVAAVRVCSKKGTVAALRSALRGAGYWPPSKLEEVDHQCSRSTEPSELTKE